MDISIINEMIETLKKINYPQQTLNLPNKNEKLLLEASVTHYEFYLDSNRKEKCTFHV